MTTRSTTGTFSTLTPDLNSCWDMETEPEVVAASLFPDLDMDLDAPATPAPQPRNNPTLPPMTTPRLRRGPMYSAYSELRSLHLRRKLELGGGGGTAAPEEDSSDDCLPTFHATPHPKKPSLAESTASSVGSTTPLMCRSVPNFRAALRKENRKPPAPAASPLPASKMARVWEAPPLPLRTPPPSLAPSRIPTARKLGSASVSVGRPSAAAGAAAARRSYSCLKELKGFGGLAGEEDEGNRKGVGRAGEAVRKSLSSMRRYV